MALGTGAVRAEEGRREMGGLRFTRGLQHAASAVSVPDDHGKGDPENTADRTRREPLEIGKPDIAPGNLRSW